MQAGRRIAGARWAERARNRPPPPASHGLAPAESWPGPPRGAVLLQGYWSTTLAHRDPWHRESSWVRRRGRIPKLAGGEFLVNYRRCQSGWPRVESRLRDPGE